MLAIITYSSMPLCSPTPCASQCSIPVHLPLDPLPAIVKSTGTISSLLVEPEYEVKRCKKGANGYQDRCRDEEHETHPRRDAYRYHHSYREHISAEDVAIIDIRRGQRRRRKLGRRRRRRRRRIQWISTSGHGRAWHDHAIER